MLTLFLELTEDGYLKRERGNHEWAKKTKDKSEGADNGSHTLFGSETR